MGRRHRHFSKTQRWPRGTWEVLHVSQPSEKWKTKATRRCRLTLERLTGREARGVQAEDTACKRQTFLSLASGRRKQMSDIFSFSIQI